MTKETVYLIQTRECIRCDKDVFKIGRTNDVRLRFAQYPAQSKLCIVLSCVDSKTVEKKLIEKFSKHFEIAFLSNGERYGNEYFRGDIEEMKKLFIDVVQEPDEIYTVKTYDELTSFASNIKTIIYQGFSEQPLLSYGNYEGYMGSQGGYARFDECDCGEYIDDKYICIGSCIGSCCSMKSWIMRNQLDFCYKSYGKMTVSLPLDNENYSKVKLIYDMDSIIENIKIIRHYSLENVQNEIISIVSLQFRDTQYDNYFGLHDEYQNNIYHYLSALIEDYELKSYYLTFIKWVCPSCETPEQQDKCESCEMIRQFSQSYIFECRMLGFSDDEDAKNIVSDVEHPVDK